MGMGIDFELHLSFSKVDSALKDQTQPLVVKPDFLGMRQYYLAIHFLFCKMDFI
jgi:hypothetical protein